MPSTSITDLPPELLDHICTHLPSASSLANLSATNKALHVSVEKSAWQQFVRTRFPSLRTSKLLESDDGKVVARSLVTLSKAWDRRAFLARYIDPLVGGAEVTSWPGRRKGERWKRPKGQTIGFTPKVDVYEEHGSACGSKTNRREIFAFSAGAEVCLRLKEGKDAGKWITYQPLSAYEGRDDITSLHLLRPGQGEAVQDGEDVQRIITGTANGDLRLLQLPLIDGEGSEEIVKTYFTTQGQPIRSSALLQQPFRNALLVAALGDSRIAMYNVDPNETKIAPHSEVDLRATKNGGTPSRSCRAWSTIFTSGKHLAVGLGPSEEPIHVYSLTPNGLDAGSCRAFSLLDSSASERTDELAPGGVLKRPTSSVYPICPLPASSTSTSAGSEPADGTIFLSGAYDGIVRLHDLRSSKDVESRYVDATDDSTIYSLLPRGCEKLVVGTSRHSLLKVFDLRMGAKCYSYINAQSQNPSSMTGTPAEAEDGTAGDWNLFLRPRRPRNSGQNWGRNGRQESSIYSLASPSDSSPYIYAGVENAVVEMAFTGALDSHPDPAYFESWRANRGPEEVKVSRGEGRSQMKHWIDWNTKDILELAMYEQDVNMRLCTQRGLAETWRGRESGYADAVDGVDERWRLGSSEGAWTR